MASWYSFVLAAPPPALVARYAQTSVFQLCGPGFLPAVAFKTALLAAVALLLPPLARRHPAFAALDRKTQLGAAGWASALIHHAAVCALSLAALRAEFARGVVDLVGLTGGVSWTCAYLLCDTLVTAVPNALEGSFDYLLHHCLGIAVTCLTLAAPASVLRLAPHVWLCELSAFGLGVSWACLKLGWSSSALCAGAELFFLLAFVLTRILNLPVVVYSAQLHGAIGPAVQAAMWAIVALQFYWLNGIVKKGVGKYGGGKAAKQV